jgi:hypothetical protein
VSEFDVLRSVLKMKSRVHVSVPTETNVMHAVELLPTYTFSVPVPVNANVTSVHVLLVMDVEHELDTKLPPA